MKTKRTSLIRLSKKGSKRQRGASLVEYGLLVALIAVIGLPAVQLVAESIKESFQGGQFRTRKNWATPME